MNAAPPRSLGARAAGTALLVAWLLLLGALGAVFGYVLFLPGPEQARPGRPEAVSTVTLELPAEPEESEAARAQKAGAPEAGAEPAKAQEQMATAPPKVEAPALEDGEGQGPAEMAAEAETKPEPAPEAKPEPAPEAKPEPAPEAKPEADVAEEAGMAAPAEAAKEAAKEGAEEAAPKAEAPPGETQEATLPRMQAPEVLPLWRRNAQPFEAPETKPRIAVVLTGLGLSSAATEAAIKQLPGPISLSFTPYSRRLNEWIALARVNGHEVLLDLPMEPISYPNDDPGPQALLTALSSRQNLARLDWALRRATGYVGVTAVMGSRFLASEEHMTPILNELKDRGLLFLDNRDSDTSIAGPLAQKIGVANAVNDRFLDRAQASRVAIDARLVQLERIARTEGFAVAIGQPYPVTIERLREWAEEVESRGFALAPLSAVAAARLARQTAARDSAALAPARSRESEGESRALTR